MFWSPLTSAPAWAAPDPVPAERRDDSTRTRDALTRAAGGELPMSTDLAGEVTA